MNVFKKESDIFGQYSSKKVYGSLKKFFKTKIVEIKYFQRFPQFPFFVNLYNWMKKMGVQMIKNDN